MWVRCLLSHGMMKGVLGLHVESNHEYGWEYVGLNLRPSPTRELLPHGARPNLGPIRGRPWADSGQIRRRSRADLDWAWGRSGKDPRGEAGAAPRSRLRSVICDRQRGQARTSRRAPWSHAPRLLIAPRLRRHVFAPEPGRPPRRPARYGPRAHEDREAGRGPQAREDAPAAALGSVGFEGSETSWRQAARNTSPSFAAHPLRSGHGPHPPGVRHGGEYGAPPRAGGGPVGRCPQRLIVKASAQR